MVHTYERVPYAGGLPPLEPSKHDALARFTINVSKRGDIGRWFRWNMERYVEPELHACVTRNQAMHQQADCLVSRNEEMYDSMRRDFKHAGAMDAAPARPTAIAHLAAEN
jgi:hypothetical protein